MATTEKYTTVIELNSEQAKRNLDELRKKVESWKSDLAEAREKKMGKSFIAAIRKELTAAEKELKKYDSEVMRTIDTMNNLNSASVERIEEAQKSLIRLSKEVPHDSPFYEKLNEQLDQVTQELENIKATKAFEQLQQEAAGANRTFEQTRAEAEFVRQTVENIDTASLKQLKMAEQTAREIKESAQQGTAEYNGAATSLEKIKSKLAEVEANERKAVSLIERYNQELVGTEKESQKVVDETQLINRTLSKLSSASVRDIEYSIRILNEQLRDTERTGGNVEDITNKLKQLNAELRKVQDMQRPEKQKEGIISWAWNGLNRNWGAFTQIIGTITGLSFAIRKSVGEFATMEEAMADTRKYTGLADAAIRELNEDLKKMDTRTSREELNQLAGSAGRLGITSKSAILEFVDAANQIKVALGDDLGEGAIDNVGKLAMAFGEDERMGLRGAMLATGSAVNELAQNSSAKAGYLVDFTARVAGFGKQLGLTQAQIMGFGAVMDENLLRDEMAATAFGNMLTKMQTDTEKFARIAGMDMKAFTDLLNNDANAAILALADNLRKADPQNMMKMLDDMGLDGSRAVGVLATLADKIDDVRARQQLATQAYKEATSIEKEYNTMNTTVEAEIEKCKKRFQEMTIELGERLLPIVRYAITGASMFTKVLAELTSFAYQNIGMITKLSVVLAEYVTIKKLHYLWTQRTVVLSKAQLALDALDRTLTSARITLFRALLIARNANNVSMGMTIKLQKILNLVFSKNPIGAVVTVVAVLTLGLWKLVDAIRGANKEKRLMNEIYDTAAEKIAEERSELNKLLRVARDEKAQLDKRKEAIEKLNRIIPGYNGQLDETTGKYTENATALATYNALLREKYRLEAAEDKMKELEKERFKKELEYEKKLQQSYERDEKNKNSAPLLQQGNGPVKQSQQYSEENVRKHLTEQYKEETAELDRQLDIVTGIRDRSKEVLDFANQFNASMENARQQLEGGGDKKEQSGGSTPYVSDADRKKQEQERKAQEREQRKQDAEERRRRKEAEDAAKAAADARMAAKTHEYAMGKIAYRQYIEDMAQLQLEGLQKRRDVYEKGSAEYEKLNREYEERAFKGDQQVNRMRLDDLRRCMLQQQMEIEGQAAREEITEQEKQERLRQLNEQFLADKVELYKEGSLERMQAEWELQDVEQRNKIERERQYQQLLQQVREQYLGMSNDRQMQIALDGLERLHREGLLKEEEYQRARIAIQAQYAGTQTASQQTRDSASDMLANAQDRAARYSHLSGFDTNASPIVGTIQNYKALMENLDILYKDDKDNHDAYLEAKRQATADFCSSLASELQVAYQQVNQVMQAASSYFSAQQEYETAQVKKKYDAQIEAAGSNQKKVKKLQEQQAKEEAAIKTKYNRKQMVIQMAQAVAQTAMNAISAYGAALQIGPLGLTLAPIAAAMATAAGMLQIAALKKQQQAQEAGYYEGGFTGGHRYKKEAGVVHEGEFVANHQAVNNPNVLPFLNFLDQAQRNNTVGSLTAQDVSRSLATVPGASAQGLIAPIVNVTTDNEGLREAVDAHREATDRLLDRLADPIIAQVVLTGPDGLNAQQERLNRMIKNK